MPLPVIAEAAFKLGNQRQQERNSVRNMVLGMAQLRNSLQTSDADRISSATQSLGGRGALALEDYIRQQRQGKVTPEARQRLATLRLTRPELVARIEALLIQLVQSGQVKGRIDDPQLKQILYKITAKKRDIKIRRI